MFSRDNNAYAKSRYNELHIGKRYTVVNVLVAEDWIYEVRGFNDRVSGVGFQSRLAPSDRLISHFEKAKFHKFVQSHPDRETVVLRSGDKVDVENYEDNQLSTDPFYT